MFPLADALYEKNAAIAAPNPDKNPPALDKNKFKESLTWILKPKSKPTKTKQTDEIETAKDIQCITC